LDEAASFRPEVVFLDIGLPRMDGYEVARRLREEVGLQEVLLVAVTGYGQEEDRRRAEEAGFQGVESLHSMKSSGFFIGWRGKG
ncbi:MAG TPA: response regulator, partial [Thermoanaerobaculia bacterium]|nr:response regulator [Thermoanaerobaculia bacterium]